MLPLNKLPNELLLNVFGHLPLRDRQSISRVSRRFSQLIDAEGYITEDCQVVFIDFGRQMLLLGVVHGYERRWILIHNGNLLCNKRPRTFGTSLFLTSKNPLLSSFSQVFIVRNLGDRWLERMGAYMTKMRTIFAEKPLWFLNVRFSRYRTWKIPKELLNLHSVHIQRLVIGNFDKRPQPLLPDKLLPLMNCCVRKLSVAHRFKTNMLSDIKPDFTCFVSGRTARRLLQQYMDGEISFGSHTQMVTLKVVGKTKWLFLKELNALRVSQNLPYVPQGNGENYMTIYLSDGSLQFLRCYPERREFM